MDDYDDLICRPTVQSVDCNDNSDANRGMTQNCSKSVVPMERTVCKACKSSKQDQKHHWTLFSITKMMVLNGVCGYFVSNGDVKWPEDYTAKDIIMNDPCLSAKDLYRSTATSLMDELLSGDDVGSSQRIQNGYSDHNLLKKYLSQEKNRPVVPASMMQ